ncbi:hypothetical protein AVEN_245052-1 [Araneus ventricosus]|uniref:Uncharacterized protein n=1 Tax=Araneus ventricosus TaxID=182803 RepID=A0A4Y2E8Z8_ARAVE|nr:hypothetical protein AVEN_245052-1 [Araneus ventricosus]
MVKASTAKFALCMKEIQRYKEQDIKVLTKEIEGLKYKLEDSYLSFGDDPDDLYQSFIEMKDTAIDILAKIIRLMAKAQEFRESLKIEDCSKSGVSGLRSLRLPGLELLTFDGDIGTRLTFQRARLQEILELRIALHIYIVILYI